MTKEARDKATAFKVGFLTKLAEIGVTPDEFHERIKQAFDPISLMLAGAGGATEAGQKVIGAGVDVGGSLLKNLAYAGLLGPLALGGTSGAMEAKLTSPSAEDIEALQNAELAAKYEQLTRMIKGRMRKKTESAL